MLGVVSKALEEGRKKIRAYHGSPHDFDRFSTDNIGTGEGAQAYGRGLYFAEREGTAQSYRDALSTTGYKSSSGKELRDMPSSYGFASLMDEMRRNNRSDEDVVKMLRSEADKDDIYPFPENKKRAKSARKLADKLEQGKIVYKSDGKMYEVNINASPDELLDYDLPLSEQSDFVKSRLPKELLDREGARGINAVKDFPIPNSEMMSNADYSQKAADALQESGIKGVKYADAQTRFSPKGKTHNYVVFDDKLVEIARKYGVTMPVAGAILAGTITPEQAQAGVVTPQKDGILKDTSDVALETVSGINRAVVDGLNFFTADQVNNVLNLMGSDKRMPNLYDAPYIKEATQGNYMDDGLPRDVVRTGSEFLSPL